MASVAIWGIFELTGSLFSMTGWLQGSAERGHHVAEAINASFASFFQSREAASQNTAADKLEIANWEKAARRYMHTVHSASIPYLLVLEILIREGSGCVALPERNLKWSWAMRCDDAGLHGGCYFSTVTLKLQQTKYFVYLRKSCKLYIADPTCRRALWSAAYSCWIPY